MDKAFKDKYIESFMKPKNDSGGASLLIDESNRRAYYMCYSGLTCINISTNAFKEEWHINTKTSFENMTAMA